jgi:hypothetical protein
MTKELIEFLAKEDIQSVLGEYLEKVDKLNEIINYVQNPPLVIE